MRRFTVDAKLVERYLESAVLSGVDVVRLLRERSISGGTPIYLDDETMMPIEPLCSWGRNMAYAELSRTRMQDLRCRVSGEVDLPADRRTSGLVHSARGGFVVRTRTRPGRARRGRAVPIPPW